MWAPTWRAMPSTTPTSPARLARSPCCSSTCVARLPWPRSWPPTGSWRCSTTCSRPSSPRSSPKEAGRTSSRATRRCASSARRCRIPGTPSMRCAQRDGSVRTCKSSAIAIPTSMRASAWPPATWWPATSAARNATSTRSSVTRSTSRPGCARSPSAPPGVSSSMRQVSTPPVRTRRRCGNRGARWSCADASAPPPRTRPSTPRRLPPPSPEADPRSDVAAGLVHPEDVAQRVADLTDSGEQRECLAHRGQKVVRALGGAAHQVEAASHGRALPSGAQLFEPLHLRRLELGADAHDLDVALGRLGEPVDADDDALPAFDQLLVAVRRILDLVLVETLLDGADRAAAFLDTSHQRARGLDEVGGQSLHQVRAPHRVGDSCRAGLEADDLLRAQSDLRCLLGRQRQGLVVAVGVQ